MSERYESEEILMDHVAALKARVAELEAERDKLQRNLAHKVSALWRMTRRATEFDGEFAALMVAELEAQLKADGALRGDK